MILFISLILTLIALNFLRDILNRSIYRYLLLLVRSQPLATYLFAILFLPGVVLHEGSHWIMAKLLWVKTYHLSLTPEWVEEGRLRFGFVEMSKADRVRSALIAVAPLFSGISVILWLAFNHLHLDVVLEGIVVLDPDMFKEGLEIFFQTPDLLLWIYLLFTISNTMLPSPTDLKVWIPVGVVIVAVYLLVVFISKGVPAGDSLVNLAKNFAEMLLKAFGIAVVLNICLVGPILSIEWLVQKGRKLIPYY
jgi:hypothetical protein